MKKRIEKDFLGTLNIPQNTLWGIHTQRAIENFGISNIPIHKEIIISLAQVKLAALNANYFLEYIDKEKHTAIKQAIEEIIAGEHFDSFPVDFLQGGAGTSLNMNINEVIANRSLQILGYNCGEYKIIDPIETINMHQSTNDVVPTAIRISIIKKLKDLEISLAELQSELQTKEKEWAKIKKLGRTQLMDGIPVTLGQEIGTYAEGIARDRWRIFKAVERIKRINIGGTAIGTGLSAPKGYIFTVSEELKKITDLPISRYDNLIDATANQDQITEVIGMIKPLITNIVKMSNDLRLLNSGPDSGIGEIKLPPVQTGSSIMPGKVNPVIPEMAINASLYTKHLLNLAEDLCAMGNLELNPFLPLIGHSIVSSLEILSNLSMKIKEKAIEELKPGDKIEANLKRALSVAAIYVDKYGYHKTEAIIKYAQENNISIEKAIEKIINENKK